MSLKNNKTRTQIVIYHTGNKIEAESKLRVKYSAWTILLVLLGKFFTNFGEIPGIAIPCNNITISGAIFYSKF